MYKYLLIILLFSFTVNAETAIEFASNQTQMKWKGVSHAQYDYNLKTLGVVYYDEDFGVRVAYGKARPTLPRNGAAIPHLIIELKHSIDVELLYRHNIYGDTYGHCGVGYYFDNFPITSTISDYTKDDWDNALGWFIGLDHKMTSRSSIQATFRHRAAVGAAQSHSGALGSSHNSAGISIRYIF